MSKFFAPLTAMVLLTACGGDGGGGASRGPALVPALVPVGITSYLDEAEDIVEAYPNRRGDGQMRTRAANLPTGRVAYDGVAGLDTDPEGREAGSQVLLGRARIDADFERNQLSGQVTDFVDERNDPVDGRLTVRNGVIDGNAVRARIGGPIAGGTLKAGLRDGGLIGNAGQGIVVTGRGRIDGGARAGGVDTALVVERAGISRPENPRGTVGSPLGNALGRIRDDIGSVSGGARGAAAGLDMNGNPITGANIGAASGELSNDL